MRLEDNSIFKVCSHEIYATNSFKLKLYTFYLKDNIFPPQKIGFARLFLLFRNIGSSKNVE